MLYISHAHKPSATLQAVSLPDFLPSGPCLALVRHTSLTFLSLPGNQQASTSPLEEIATFPLNARILAVQPLACSEEGRKSKRLAVLTDHHNPRLILLIHNDAGITTESNLSLDQVARAPAELGLDLLVEPFNGALGQKMIALHTHSGLLNMVPISDGASRTSTSSKRRASRNSDANVTMEDVASGSSSSGKPDTAQSFGVRLPHPTLISSAFLHPADVAANPALALLSLSSVPSRIPGLGQQCLPVLSFHSVSQPTQELLPIPWGPPRHAPAPIPPSAPSSNQGPSGSQNAPGSSSNDATTPTKEDKRKQARKKHGPSALGDRLDPAGLHQREEKWAQSALTRAHVPLPYVDALGAHLIHSIPAKAGGGVIVFSENSILYVPPPTAEDTRTPAAATSFTEAGPVVQGKRRKASTSDNTTQARRADAESVQSPSASSSRSNENGKRRRSSAAMAGSPPTSPSSTRGGNRGRTRLLRTSLPIPVQVAAATTIIDSDGSFGAEEGQPQATLNVLFACISGSLNLLRLRLARSPDDSTAFQPVSLTAETLGAVPQAAGPNALTYLGESFVQVSSATGDAVLYRIVPNEGSSASAIENDGDAQMITPPSSPPRSMPPPRSFASFAEANDLPVGGRLEEVHRWCNLGPIVDFAVDDGSGGDPSSGSSAQARIVTCSGSGPTGSLRVVRSGVGVTEMAQLDVQGASKVWSVHAGSGAVRTTTMLVLGYITSNAFLAFQPDGSLVDVGGAVAGAGLLVDSPILAVSSLESANATVFAVANKQQVAVAMMQDGSVQILALLAPESAIVTAAVNEHGQVLLSLADRSLVHLQFDGASTLQEVTRVQLAEETSCLDISPLQAGQPAKYAAAGLWGTKTAQIYTLPELQPVAQSSFCEHKFSSLPRSILLHHFEHSGTSSAADGSRVPHLLIGLGDGTLVSYSLSLPTADSFSETVGVFEPKFVSLGNRALRLEKIQTSQGLLAVSVAGERPTIVYADSKRVSYSSVAYKGVRSVATLHAAGQPAINAFAMPDHIQLAAVGALQKLDIKTIPLGGDQPLGIAQDASSRVFGVVTWAFLPRGTATKSIGIRGAVRILDQTELVTLDEVRLEPDERPNCIESVTLDGKPYLVVGTGFVHPDSNETTSGRIIGFEVQTGRVRQNKEERELKRAFEHKVRGNVYAIVGIQGRLAAAVNSEVQVFEASKATLRQRGNWGCAFVACTLAVAEGNRLVAGDALRSMNLLEVDGESGKITEVARDCDPFWTTAAEMVDEKTQTLIGADIAFNLYTTQRVLLSDEAKRRIKKAKEQEMESGRKVLPSSNALGDEGGYAHVMQRQAVYHYGDMINKFKRGSLVPTLGSGKVADPRILFCTAAGAIGVISHLDDEHAMLISHVERNIVQVLEQEGGGGGIPQSEWRTLRTDHRVQAPAGFIDGEVVQAFSNGRLDRAQRERVLAGPSSEMEKITADREKVERVVEALGQLC